MAGQVALTGQVDVVDYALDRFQKLSKGAFDSKASVNIQKTFDEAASFGDAVVTILHDAGVKKEHLSGLAGENVGSDDWLDAFKGMAVQAEEYAVETAIGGAVTWLFGPSWGAWAESWWSKRYELWKEQKQKVREGRVAAMKPGMWVYVNNGLRPGAPIGQEPGWKEGLRRRRMKFAPEPMEDISVGFFIGPAGKGRVKVFNFDVFREQDVRYDDMAPVEKSKSSLLDASDVMRKIRNYRMIEYKRPSKLNTDVPTDPGSEVVLSGEKWNVVKAEGSQLLIEDSNGERKEVSVDKLTTGRKVHDNSWNYRGGKQVQSGFNVDGKAQVFSGIWTWIMAREALLRAEATTHELAVVWYINDDGVHTVMALDGMERVVATLWAVTDNLSEGFNQNKAFNAFRHAVVAGGDTARYRLGAEHLLVCLGKTQEIQMKFPDVQDPFQEIVETGTKDGAPVGSNEKDVLDVIEEVAAKTGIAPGQLDAYEEAPDDIGRPNGGYVMGLVAFAASAYFILNNLGM